MRIAGWIAVLFLASGAAAADVILTMKSGERYELPRPPRHKSGMLSFTTKNGRFLTVREAEVAKEETFVPPPPKVKLDRTDTKQLGAIAREQRAERGITADVAGKDGGAGTSEPSSKASPEAAAAGRNPPAPAPRAKKRRTRRRPVATQPAPTTTEDLPPPL